MGFHNLEKVKKSSLTKKEEERCSKNKVNDIVGFKETPDEENPCKQIKHARDIINSMDESTELASCHGNMGMVLQ